ncbi:seryl-tRNA synthetase-like insect mitochondrial protein isoform X2 [Dermacentor variabilis]|uniref:seryl-tRNA synthetase-like insect mitochondrial protein isoform X2 n=1 Tax=Dermacentor variabilis TaxID=34621 RepID=UPI003F5B230F
MERAGIIAKVTKPTYWIRLPDTPGGRGVRSASPRIYHSERATASSRHDGVSRSGCLRERFPFSRKLLDRRTSAPELYGRIHKQVIESV